MKSALAITAFVFFVAALAASQLSTSAQAQSPWKVTSKLGGGAQVEISWPAQPEDILTIVGKDSYYPGSGGLYKPYFVAFTVPSDRYFVLRNLEVIWADSLATNPYMELWELKADGTQILKRPGKFLQSYWGSSIGISFEPGSKIIFLNELGNVNYMQCEWAIAGFLADSQ